MKGDLEKKASYLMYLRVSTKFLLACECEEPVHSYCITAKIIRTKSIFCERCKEPYRLFIKEEKMCSSRLFKLLALYFVVLFCSIGVTVGVIILDGFLKKSYVNAHPD